MVGLSSATEKLYSRKSGQRTMMQGGGVVELR